MIGNVLYTIAALAVVLGVLVFVHELGHYTACKVFGVWVHRFSVGFGKPIPGLTFQRGETEWVVAWLPLGGYVKMASREADAASSAIEGAASSANVPPDRVFEAKPLWQRIVILLAGVTFNAIFALLVFIGLAWKNGRQYNPTTTVGHVTAAALPKGAEAFASIPPGTRILAVDGDTVRSWDDVTGHFARGAGDTIRVAFANHPPLEIPIHRDALVERMQLVTAVEPVQGTVLGTVAVNTPAARAGLRPGDSLVAIDSTPIRSWEDAVNRIQPAAGDSLAVTFVRGGERHTVTLVPDSQHVVPTDSTTPMIGRIGVASQIPYRTQRLTLPGAVAAGAGATWTAAGTVFTALRGLFNGAVSVRSLGGPILIGQMAASQAKQGLDDFLAFMAWISINLAVVNLAPIPILDGGGVVMALIEGAIRRPLPMRVREAFSLLGLAILVLLMVLVFRNDIAGLLAK